MTDSSRRSRFSMPQDWIVLAWIVFMHVGALAGIFTFSWKALGVCVFLWWLTGGIGICLGFHRYFTHRSFTTSRPVEYFLAVMGCLAGEAGPISWVAAHRYHHTYSDTDKDPHSPLKGFLWAHFTWLFGREDVLAKSDSCKRFTPDMAKDPFLVWLDKFHMLPAAVLAGVLVVLGGWPFLVWGMFVRSVLVYHSTWFVNSASHIWGYRSFQTQEMSRNNWWVALLSFGEGWHNNHHAFQRSARHGMRWWEVDLTYRTIQLLWALGLASDIHLPIRTSANRVTVPVADFDVRSRLLLKKAVGEV
ncbi:MAG: fatty acid desaturase [Candidatus Omnitrophica bacterium]|nr:fatty acid desaturase [Candidatus Omnitrophota bacterium]